MFDFLKRNKYSPFPVDLVREFGRQLLESIACVWIVLGSCFVTFLIFLNQSPGSVSWPVLFIQGKQGISDSFLPRVMFLFSMTCHIWQICMIYA